MRQILTGIAVVLMMSFGMAQNDTIGSYINVNAEITNESTSGAQDGAIDIEITEGVEPFQISWSNGGITEDLINLYAGVYVLTVIDAEQTTGVFSFFVSNDSIPNDTIVNDPCFGFYAQTEVTPVQEENGSIDLIVIGGDEPYIYTWSNGATTQDIFDLEEGAYFVEVSDANGCIFILQEYVYNLGSDSIPNDTIINDPCFGFYGFTYAAPIQQISGSIDLTVYGGEEPYSYLWNNGATTQDILDLEEGMYSVIVNDANGCTFTLEDYVLDFSSDSIPNDTVFDFPCFGFYAMGYPTYTSVEGAADGAIDIEVFGGTAPYSFLWNNEATTEDISDLEEGFYSVMIEDADGCETAYMEYIYTSYLDSNIWDFPVDSFANVDPIDSCFQISINTAEINSYEFFEDSVLVTWNILSEDGNLMASFILSYIAELDDAGVYQFEISFIPCDTRALNELNSFVDQVYIDPAVITSISDQSSLNPSQFEIFPNPVNDFANIKLEAQSRTSSVIEIISINGQIMIKENTVLNKGVNNIQINTSRLQKGVYLLKITDANGLINIKRLVK